MERYPIKPKKQAQPKRYGHVYLLLGSDGTILTERRPDKGLLGGMLGLPTSSWTGALVEPEFPTEGNWRELGEVRHVFTHFALTLKVWGAETDQVLDTTRAQAADGLPTVFAKALKLASK